MKNYKELQVWQKSILLAEEIYSVTLKFPRDERFGLASQMQRAAVSISSNIAEGAKRNYTNEYIQFLGIANGSAAELETQLVIAKRVYPYPEINYDTAEGLTIEVLKMLNILINNLQTRLHPIH